jgi:anaerobic magnesium-protoporphyrin IX monomethyl ester cyclase
VKDLIKRRMFRIDNMMKLRALIVIHDNHQDSNHFSLGAGYVAASLRENGVEVETFCMDVYHYTNEDLIRHLKENEKYDMILLGFMVPRFRRTVRSLCHTIKENIDEETWFVLGGYGPSAIPEYIIEQTGADIVCIGEAEHTVVEIANCKKGKGKSSLSEVLGIVYSDGKDVFSTKRRSKNKKLDTLEFPAWDLFPMHLYTTSYKFAGMSNDEKAFPIIASRGCTDRCSFCFRLESGIRSRSTENVIEEMLLLNTKYGVNYFKFSDELAIISKKQILKLTQEIKLKLPTIHYRMDCRVSLFDDEIATALKESGCVFLNIGFESSSQMVLDQMNKRATVEQNINAAETAIRHRIGMGLNVIWGMPGDDEKSLRDNAEFIKKYNQYDQIRTIRPVSPYPGSPLYYQAIAEKKLTGPQDFFDRFKNSDRYMVNFTDLSEEKIYSLLGEVNKDLIFDHFKNTTGDMIKAQNMVDELLSLYADENHVYTGPRHYGDNKELKSKYNLLDYSYLMPEKNS